MNAPTDSPGPAASSGRTGLGVVLGLAASAAFATSGPFARPLLLAGWSPGAAVFWRVLGASALLLPAALWLVRAQPGVVRREWRAILAFGVLAVATPQLMYFAAVARMEVSIALLIEYMAPVLLVGLAWLRSRRPPSRLVLAGSAASVTGLLLVLDPLGASPDALGVAFAFAAMVGAASYFVLSARPTPLPALTLAGFGLAAGTVVLGLAILVGLLPYAAPLTTVTLLGAQVPWWLPLGVVIVSATALAYGLGVAGIVLMGERLASFVSLSEVLFAGGLAALLLGELPGWLQLAGGALIIVGVVLIRLASGRQPAGLPTLPEELAAADLA